jgi:hypothetical protein
MGCHSSNGELALLDGGGVVCFVGRRGEDYAVGGFYGAAAVDEFGVDAAVFSGAEGQADVLSGFAVVGGVGVVADEDPVADGDAVLGKDPGECGNGGCVRLGLPWLAVLGGVEGEDDTRRAGVTGEITADRPGVGKFCSGVSGEVDAERGPDLAFVQVMQTKLSFGQKPRVCPMKLSKSAGSLIVSAFIVPFLCPYW